MGDPGQSDGGEDLLSACLPIVERIVEFVCRRNRVVDADAEDFASYVTLKLLADDSAKLRQFAGRSSIQTFLSVVIERLFLDFRRASWGKWRPSVQAVRLGQTAMLVEQLTVRDGYALEEAYELVTTNHRIVMSRTEFNAIVAQLPARQPRRFDSDGVLVDIPATSATPDETLLAIEAGDQERQVKAALQHAMASLTVQDRLVLTMRFRDGRSVAEIAGALGLEQKALYRRVERILKDLRRQLEADGVDASRVVGVFAGQGGSSTATRNPAARPSLERGTG
jgi:RNA polymerase sigma factor (sigma-70 family)